MITFNIYIPTQDNKGNKLSNLNLKSIYAEKMSFHFGGVSIYDIQGGYVTQDNLYIVEDVAILSSFGEMNTTNTSFLTNLAKEVKEVAKQESVLIVIDSKPSFL